MERISKFFIENYRFSIILTLFVVIFGAGGLFLTNSESFPTVNIGQVIIQTPYPGASADEIELKITKPIEDEIRSVTGIDEVKSVSQPGLSRIFTVVDIDRYNAEDVVSDLQRAVDRVSNLPADLDTPPSFVEIKTEEFPVIELAVVGSNQNRIRDKAAYDLAELLEDNKKISSIIKKGYSERQFHILVNPNKLDQQHVSLDEVIQKIVAQNQTIPGGNIEAKGKQTLLKIDGKRRTVGEIESTVLRSNFSGEKILLKDVAKVIDRDEEPVLINRYNGDEATVLIISKKSGADLVDLAEEVKQELKAFEEKYNGQLSFHIYNDEGMRVKSRIEVLSSNAIAGLVLVVVFLIIFLPGRSGIMAALSLPLTVLAIFAYMNMNGLTLNTITILAMVISIGMLVDNSVVISENFKRLTEDGINSKTAILKSIKALWLPITGTALTTIAAFLPMLVTTGVIGQFIRGIPIVVSIALILSLFESFILLPVRLVKAKDAEETDENQGQNSRQEQENHDQERQSDWFSRLILPYFSKLIQLLIRFRYITLILFTGIIAGSLYMMIAANKFILFPAGQTEIYISRIELPSGTTLEKTDHTVNELTAKIKSTLGDNVAHIVATSGNSETQPNDPKSKNGENVAMIKIFMTNQAKNSMATAKVLSMLRSISLADINSISFEAVVNGPPASDAVSGILRSNNPDQLEAAAEDLKRRLANVSGIIDVQIDDVFGEDEVIINVDEPKAARLGLNLTAIGRTIRSAMAGQAITDVNLNNREVEFFVRLDSKFRENTEQLAQLKILNQRGDLIPLSQVASFEKIDGRPHIKRFDFKKAKTITGGVVDTKMTAAEANAKLELFFNEMSSTYPDVTLQFAGEGERIKESMTSLASALILAVIAIFALLVFLFHSYAKPLIILTTVPLGLFGVAVAFYLQSMPISFLALIGVVGLSGIIVNSGIVLISFIDQLRKENNAPLGENLVKASELRLRAVVVTSLTTVSGLLPTSYGIGGSDQFIIPMTMAMAWGLVSGTILALLWVPCAYAIFDDISQLTAKIFRVRANKNSILSEGEVKQSLSDREAFNVE